MRDEEREAYEKRIRDLKDTIKVLEENTKDTIETKLLNNTDTYAIKFVRTLSKDDFCFVSTREMFDKFIEYRRQFTTKNEDLVSIRMLNNTIKSFFPSALIKHANKKGKNVYYWVVE